jgi:vacuolar-type H+-ATPase subunit E/Vma4
MLSKIIEDHVDAIEQIEADFQEEIDKAISSIDIEALMADPQATLEQVAELVKEKIRDKYSDRIVALGKEFSQRIQEKDVTVDLSKDPDKNDDEN